MNEQIWSLTEMLGHWLLAWSVVVGLILVWLKVARPRRAAVRYAAWLLATFAGMALLPIVVAVGPRTSWRVILTALRPDSSCPPRTSRSLPVVVRSNAGRRWAETAGDDHRALAGSLFDEWADECCTRLGCYRTVNTAWYARISLASDRSGYVVGGIALFTARLTRSAFQVRTLLARLDWLVPVGLTAEMETLRAELGIRRSVRLAIQPEIAAPCASGLVRPDHPVADP